MKTLQTIFISFFITCFLHGQKSFEDARLYMKDTLPEGWSMKDKYDSTLVFQKVVHWSEMLDPPPDSYGYDDTMYLFVKFHPYQDEIAQLSNLRTLHNIDQEKQAQTNLRKQHNNGIYKDKKGFYDFMYKLQRLRSEKDRLDYFYFSNCSITFFYWRLGDPLINYDEEIDKEADQIKETLINYLK